MKVNLETFKKQIESLTNQGWLHKDSIKRTFETAEALAVNNEFKRGDITVLTNIARIVNGVVENDVDFSYCNLTELPDLSDVIVLGSFSCYGNKITSLKGAPKEVHSGFGCGNNQLESLIYSPNCKGGYSCTGNNLLSLEGAPESIDGDFDCSGTGITSLKYAPKHISGKFYCTGNNLTSLEWFPEYIGESFSCAGNPLTSLLGYKESFRGRFNIDRKLWNTLDSNSSEYIQISSNTKLNLV